ncbi:MAG: hypothetical protein ACPLZD_08555 [Candidatus Saccharicenans sp.]
MGNIIGRFIVNRNEIYLDPDTDSGYNMKNISYVMEKEADD